MLAERDSRKEGTWWRVLGGVDRGEGNKIQVGGLFFSPRGKVIIGDNIKIREVILMTSGKRVIRANGYTVGPGAGRKNRLHASAITNGVTVRLTSVRNTPQV